eukprot:evm.model.scf_1621.1 EVM.evm.TU.scf_1621.1   scf_1621:591-5673(-)
MQPLASGASRGTAHHAHRVGVPDRSASWGGRGSAGGARSAMARAEGREAQPQDKFVSRLMEACAPEGAPEGLRQLQAGCLSAAQSLYMPTTRNEDYRFTDLAPLLRSNFEASLGSTSVVASVVQELGLTREQPANTVVLVDGVLNWELSSLGALPDGVYVGGLEGAPQETVQACLGAQSNSRGGPFAILNGAMASDVLTIVVEEGVIAEVPIHVIHMSTGARDSEVGAAAPRLLVSCGARSSAEVVEEYASTSADAGNHFVTSVCEIDLSPGASLTHGYVQLEGSGAYHMKTTLVSQGQDSSYRLTETSVGGGLTRHDVGIVQ